MCEDIYYMDLILDLRMCMQCVFVIINTSSECRLWLDAILERVRGMWAFAKLRGDG